MRKKGIQNAVKHIAIHEDITNAEAFDDCGGSLRGFKNIDSTQELSEGKEPGFSVSVQAAAYPGNRASPDDFVGHGSATSPCTSSIASPADGDALQTRRPRFSASSHFSARSLLLIPNAEEVKQKVREQVLAGPAWQYHSEGVCQAIVRSCWFPWFSVTIVAMDSMWATINTNYDLDMAPANERNIYQIFDAVMILFFLFEFWVRLNALTRKRDGLKDSWLVFDGTILFLTTSVTGVNTLLEHCTQTEDSSLINPNFLRIVRLLKCIRMARITRLLRCVPEFAILANAFVIAFRSVFVCIAWLTCVQFVYSNILTIVSKGTVFCASYFPTVQYSMYTLTIVGVFMIDTTEILHGMFSESPACLVIFLSYVLLSVVTVMNLLIGILCEVVIAVSAAEQEAILVSSVKAKMLEIFSQWALDTSCLSKNDFIAMIHCPHAVKVLHNVGVDVAGLVDYVDVVFEGEILGEIGPREYLSCEELTDLMLKLRGCNTATHRDIVDVQKLVQRQVKDVNAQVSSIRLEVRSMTALVCKELDEVKALLRGPKTGFRL